MRGAGLFGIIRAIGKVAAPLAKRVVKSVARHSIKGGAKVLNDVISGENLGQSLRKRALQETKSALGDFVSSSPSSQKRKQKRRKDTPSRKRRRLTVRQEAY